MEFMRDISIIMRRMRVLNERFLAPLDMGFSEELVLMYLNGHGRSNQEAIAEGLRIDKGAIAKTVATLEGRGMVTRLVNPQDHREKLVEVTDAGRQALGEMTRGLAAWQRVAFEGVDPADLAVTRRVLATMAANVSAEDAEER